MADLLLSTADAILGTGSFMTCLKRRMIATSRAPRGSRKRFRRLRAWPSKDRKRSTRELGQAECGKFEPAALRIPGHVLQNKRVF